jgi:hypothetical protein
MPKKSVNKARRRFVIWFFVLGTLVPIILVLIGLLLPSGLPLNGMSGKVVTVLGLAIWPTCILMMDAEHAREIAIMLAIAAPLNGLWYAVIGRVVWFLRQERNIPLQ